MKSAWSDRRVQGLRAWLGGLVAFPSGERPGPVPRPPAEAAPLVAGFAAGALLAGAAGLLPAPWGMRLAVFPVAGLLAFAALHNWRAGIVLFFAWILVEDLARKFAGNDLALYAAKDLLVAATYAGAWVSLGGLRGIQARGVPAFARGPLAAFLALSFVWALAMTLNPGVGSPLVGLLGLRMTFFYAPMLALGFVFLDHRGRMHRFLALQLGLGALVAALGIVQALGGLGLLNPSGGAPGLVLENLRDGPGLKLLRPNSVFVDTGRFSAYLLVVFFAGAAHLGALLAGPAQGRRPRGLAAVLGALVLVFGGIFLSGQRAAILWIAASPVFFLAPFLVLGRRVPRRSLVRGTAVVGGLALAALGTLLILAPVAGSAWIHVYLGAVDPTSPLFQLGNRPGSYLGAVWDVIVSAPLAGHGTGTGSLGLQYLAGDGVYPYHVEGGFATVAWEWGGVGLALWLAWTAALLAMLGSVAWRLRRAAEGWWAWAVLGLVFFLLGPWFLLGMQVYQNFAVQPFLWFLAGAVIRLPSLPVAAADAAGAPASARPAPPPTATRVARVLVLAPPLGADGGVQRYTLTLARALADLLGPERVRVLSLRSPPGGLTLARKLAFAIAAARTAVRWRPDLFVCAHVGLAPVGRVLRALLRRPYWVAAYGIDVWGRLPLLKAAGLTQANLVIAISAFTRDRVADRHGIRPERMALLPCNLDDGLVRLPPDPVAFARSGVPSAAPVILTVGRLAASERYKGHDTVLRALPAVLRAVPQAVYVVVGDGDDRPRLEALARDLGVAGNVRFLGRVEEAMLAACYRACAVFAMPAATAADREPPAGEGFGIVFLEAMAFGKPVIGPDRGAPTEFICDGEHGLLVPPGDPAALAQALLRLLEDPDYAAKLGEAARHHALTAYSYGAFRGRLADLLAVPPPSGGGGHA